MRILVAIVLLAVSLAGCTSSEGPVDPLVGSCPQWIDGEALEGTLMTGESLVFDAPDTHGAENRSLDRYHVVVSEIQLDGTVHLRAEGTDGRTFRFTDYRDPAAPRTPTFIALDGGSADFEADIFLTDLTHGTDAMPTGLRLMLDPQDGSSGSVSVTVTPGYRVCGAPV